MAIHELVLTSEVSGQTIINVFHYVSSGTPASVSRSFGLVSAFGGIPVPVTGGFPSGTPMEALQGAQSDELEYKTLLAQNIYPNEDFYENPLDGETGASSSSDVTPPFVSIGFRSTRVNRAFRRGTKRFAGIPETSLGEGGTITPASIPFWETIGELLAEPLTYDDEGNTITYTPAIVSKEKYAVPDSDPVRYAYRYYADEAVQMANLYTGFQWQLYTNVRSQTSRQIGRGI